MVVRIAGVTIPMHKHTCIGLQAIYGIGETRAYQICDSVNIEPTRKISDLDERELDEIRQEIAKFEALEGDLRRKVAMDIKRLMDIGCYRGRRHRNGLPVRGQSSKTNARTRKGRRKTQN